MTVYEADSFAAAAPANAHDMVLRLPGFSIVEADTDVRGYAGARGNVLIDGAQPTSRREDIVSLLQRIPAASVERIEVIRGGAPGIDMGGHAVLANVVRERAATSEMATQLGVAIASDGWAGPQGQFEYGRRRDDRVLEFALSAERELDDDTGPGRIRAFAPDGALLEDLDTRTRRVNDVYGSSASWRQPLAGGSLGVNAALRGERVDEAMTRFDRATGTRTEIADDTEDTREFEIGGRYVRHLGEHSRLELMASQRLGRLQALSLSHEDDDEERFEEDTDSGETLLRVELGREWSPRLRLSAGLEGAFNFLESQARLSENGERIDLPGSDVRIEERRAEAMLAAAWQPAKALTVEAGVRVETSALRQSGDTPMERDFVYFKPRLTGYWERDDRNGFHLGLSREVGQLDFGDFVASAALDTGVVSAGNAELEPDKTWRLVAGWERSFGEDGALGVTWTHERISDVVDRVPVVSGEDVYDAPGNIGDGRRDTLELELSGSLDRIGMTGFRLSSKMLWRTSSVVDPTTNETRGISGESPLEGRIRLTQILPAQRMTWGIELELAERETKYSHDEVRHERDDLSWNVFAEKRLGGGWRVRAEMRDLFGRRFSEARDKYDGLRAQVPLDERETRSHRTPGQVLVTLRRSVGG
ncbi:MAG TPA: TonB-dependent receptor [Luteimonas sp.]|nr:TonB-dependent receptor [Luteimonas sp.]HRP71477.1 TonB-dependent receptor [Luteimonas sp.]